MTRNLKPKTSLIKAAREKRTTREETAILLREWGYGFRNSWLWAQLDELYPRQPDDPDPEEEEVETPGVIESADKRREMAQGKTHVFTSAQSNTKVHQHFLDALRVYCKHKNAVLHISRFTYNKASFGKKSVKPGADTQEGEKLWFDPAIVDHVSDESLQLADDLVWCGELNVIPTMKLPLTQFKTYTRQDSAIIPHAKMAMESVPTMKGFPTKMLYTTGAVTQRNYIEKTAGQVADFHHVFGAVIVEIDDDDTWWVRQINAKNDGSFYDLNEYFTHNAVFPNQRVQAVTHGDIHWDKKDKEILLAVFNDGGILDTLRPREQFFHDTIDFAARNHHNIKDGHFLHEMHKKGLDNVAAEFEGVGQFLSTMAYREWSHTVIVTSNHDQAVEVWLRNHTVLTDPVNIKFWHRLNYYCHEMIDRGTEPRPFAFALSSALGADVLNNMTMVHEDDSYLILDTIQAGLHGHLGPNGARGAPKNLRTVGKANTAHTHTAGIVDGVYTTGLYAKLDMGYNKGLSSWSHSLIVTYPNAKRAILTIKNGKAWR